jgi:hypothetical protein
MCMNCVGSCPHDSLAFRFFRKEKEVASPDLGRRRTIDRPGCRRSRDAFRSCAPTPAWARAATSGCCRPPGALDEPGVSLALHSLRRVHEGVPQQLAPSHAQRGRPGRIVDAHAGAAHRLLRAELRALLRGLPHRRHLADYAEGKGLGGGRGRRRISRSGWARRSTTAAAACRGRWPPNASSARSGARFRPRPSTCRKRRSSTRPATPKH